MSWLVAVDAADFEPAALLTFNAYDTAIAVAVAGQGVVVGRRPIIDRLLRIKVLMAPFKGQWSMERSYTLVMSSAARRRPAAMALHHWLQAQAPTVTSSMKCRRTTSPQVGINEQMQVPSAERVRA